MAGESPRGRDGCRGHGRAGSSGERAKLCILGSSLFFQPQTPIPAQPLTSPRTLRATSLLCDSVFSSVRWE